MYFNNILYSLIVICSIGFVQKQVFASSLYFTAPPQGFGLSENNIGGYNAAQEKIYTCISAYMDGRVATGVNFDALEMEVADDTLRN